VKLPIEDDELRSFVLDQRRRLLDLDERMRHGDKSAFKAMKLARKDFNVLIKELRQQLRHARDDDRRDMLEELLAQVDDEG